jgi:hypothetical protein
VFVIELFDAFTVQRSKQIIQTRTLFWTRIKSMSVTFEEESISLCEHVVIMHDIFALQVTVTASKDLYLPSASATIAGMFAMASQTTSKSITFSLRDVGDVKSFTDSGSSIGFILNELTDRWNNPISGLPLAYNSSQ